MDPQETDLAPKFARLLERGESLLQAISDTSSILRPSEGDFYPVLVDDEAIEVALPFVSFERYQRSLAIRRELPKSDLIPMILNLIPQLPPSSSYVEVGAFTGALGLSLRRFLKPEQTHLIEGRKVVQDALQRTAARAGGADVGIHVHHTVIGARGQMMNLADTRPDKMSEGYYIRRSEGKFAATALDDLELGAVKFLMLDFKESKIDALHGAENLIKENKPLICFDQSGRDVPEVRDFLEPQGYIYTVVSDNYAMFLPK